MSEALTTQELQFLDSSRVGRLATFGATGKDDKLRPHCVPVCFARMGGEIWIPIDQKPKRHNRLRRLQNIEAHPEVTLLLDRYEEDWNQLAFLMIEGQAEVREMPEDVICELRVRYPQYQSMKLSLGIAIVPLRSVFWSAASAY